MRAKELELLSPAGNIEIFKSAIDAGADAVYFGGDLFGARAYAKNFSIGEGTEAIRYAHLYGRQAYLTVNTLLKNLEIERDLYKYIRAYYEAGLDAVIVQDMGVFAMLRSYFPDLALHASTQMTLAGADGAALLQKQGASRIVTSRELSIAEIAEIYQKTGIEIETFIHGALCICYSGQCLMSSMLGGRSGNRGRCAQPCRLPYDLLDEHGKKSSMPGQYLLSPKDLCGIDYIKALAEAGVYSFKIEGRMKQKEYATGVVSLYRRYMDAYLEGRDLPVSKADRQRIFDLGNRKGFTHAYFTRQNDPDMITYTKPSHEKADLATTEPVAEKLGVSGRCYLQIGCPARLCVSYQDGKRAASVEVFGDVVETAGKTPITEEQVEVKLKKTGNTPFTFSDLEITLESGAFLPMGRINEIRRNALDALLEQIEKGSGKREPALDFEKLEMEENGQKADALLHLLVTCQTKDQYVLALEDNLVKTIGLPLAFFIWEQDKRLSKDACLEKVTRICENAHAKNKEIYLLMPPICRKKETDLLRAWDFLFADSYFDGMIVASYDGLGFLESIAYPRDRVILDHRLYTFSDRSQQAFAQMGYPRNTAPLELNAKELRHRYNAASYMLLYGRISLMITANCQNANARGCDHRPRTYYLQDRYKERFPVKNCCAFCYNEIYNSKIYQIISENKTLESLGFFGYRMDFSFETKEEMKQVLARYENAFYHKGFGTEDAKDDGNYTKGHFKRGVE